MSHYQRKNIVKRHKPVESHIVLEILQKAGASGVLLSAMDLHDLMGIPFLPEDRARMRATLARLIQLGCVEHHGTTTIPTGRVVPTVRFIKDLPHPRTRVVAESRKKPTSKPKVYAAARDIPHSNHFTDGLPRVASVFALAGVMAGTEQALAAPKRYGWPA